MKRMLVYTIMLMLPLLAGCGNGAEGIPELSSKILNAFKKNDIKALLAAAPTAAGMEKAYEKYLPREITDNSKRKAEAQRREKEVQADLKKSMQRMEKDASEMKLNWAVTTILDVKYTLTDHKEDYKDAQVRVIMVTNHVKNVYLYHCYLFGNRWYLVDGLKWEES